MDLLWVTLAALVTALATGLGAVPFVLMRRPSPRLLGVSNAVAAGFMLSASGALAIEGAMKGAGKTALGAALGALTIMVAHRAIPRDRTLVLGVLRGADARKAVLIIAVMTVHITVAIAVHNIPEGLAISLLLVPRGASVPAAAGWSIFSSLPQPLMAAPAFAFVEAFSRLLPVGLGFAAGAMTWLVLRELIPDARAELRPRDLGFWLLSSVLAMSALQALLLAR